MPTFRPETGSCGICGTTDSLETRQKNFRVRAWNTVFSFSVLVAKFLIEEKGVLKNTEVACESKKSKDTASLKKMTYILLVVFLILGTLTPAMEFLRGFHEVKEYGIHNEKYDDIYTLGCDGPYDKPGETITYGNFVCVDPNEDLFFKVFADK